MPYTHYTHQLRDSRVIAQQSKDGHWAVTDMSGDTRIIHKDDFDRLYAPFAVKHTAYLLGVLEVSDPKVPRYLGCEIFSESSPSTTSRIRFFVIHETHGASFQAACDAMEAELRESLYLAPWVETLGRRSGYDTLFAYSFNRLIELWIEKRGDVTLKGPGR